MGFLPSLKKILMWIYLKITRSRIFNSFFSLFIFKKYKELHDLKDSTHLQSWFRDQVLHPHETLHAIEEIIQLLPELGCRLVSTSINRFKSIEDQQNLIEEEKTWHKVAEKRLNEKKYFPGFFVFLLQKDMLVLSPILYT